MSEKSVTERGICPTCKQYMRGSYYEEGGEKDSRFMEPCDTCKSNVQHDHEFPCNKCIDNVNAS